MNQKFKLSPKGKTMNWKKAFNLAISELKDELYSKCSKVYSVNEAMFSEIYEKVTESYNITTISSLEELRSPEFSELIAGVMKSHQEEIVACMDDAYEFSQKAPLLIIDKCTSLATIRQKDVIFLQRSIALAHKAIVSQIEYFLKETVENFSNNMEDYLGSLTESLEFTEELEDNNEELTLEDSIGDSTEDKFACKKIFCYKEMEKLALSNGYAYKWSNGSHNIYEHNSSSKIVVIPAHDLGLGLSIKIQKQIFNNAC